MTAPTAARVKCPRCDRPLVRNHDELICLTHGQAYCSRPHRLPFAAPAGCWREQFWCDNCGAQALLVLEPLASFAGAES